MSVIRKRTRYFNTTGACDPKRHYMVDIGERLEEIRHLIDWGEYFTINRARQYGKTTTLKALVEYLREDYAVLPLDFQMIGNEEFENAHIFSISFTEYILDTVYRKQELAQVFDKSILENMRTSCTSDRIFSLRKLFTMLSHLCKTSAKPVVLIIDEIDNAANNQVFLDFLAQLRAYYLKRDELSTFQSVILAGVHDVKNIRRKIRPEEAHKINSPWNIAADFKVEMGFSVVDIAGMLRVYEADCQTGMNVEEIAAMLYKYTSGYPFLVSRLCKLIDEDVAGSSDFPDKTAAWTKKGFLEAVKILLMEKNTLFESLIGKLYEYPDLNRKLQAILFAGKVFAYNPDDMAVDIAVMFGFIKNNAGTLTIANCIFETRLYNYFLTTGEAQESEMFTCGADNKPQFIRKNRLDMEMVLKKFVEYFRLIYGDNPEKFDEEEGRRRFLLYLRPIINGAGNYYIEAETRNSRRMDIVVDYAGEQFVIELKIWRGNAYNERGEQQLSEYLDYFHLKKGYMLSYNFNQKKKTGLREILLNGRILLEAVV